MPWIKKGLLYVPSRGLAWERHHAIFPTVESAAGDRLRIYYTSLDDQNDGRTAYIEVSAGNPSEVLKLSDKLGKPEAAPKVESPESTSH